MVYPVTDILRPALFCHNRLAAVVGQLEQVAN
jgi:hypothetical protein